MGLGHGRRDAPAGHAPCYRGDPRSGLIGQGIGGRVETTKERQHKVPRGSGEGKEELVFDLLEFVACILKENTTVQRENVGCGLR